MLPVGASRDLTTSTGCFRRGSRTEPGTFATVIGWGSIPMCVYTAGTPNNHVWIMDDWLNNNFQCKDLESSNWNNHKELVVWSSRLWLHIMWSFAFHILHMNQNSLQPSYWAFVLHPETSKKRRANLRGSHVSVRARECVIIWSWSTGTNSLQTWTWKWYISRHIFYSSLATSLAR